MGPLPEVVKRLRNGGSLVIYFVAAGTAFDYVPPLMEEISTEYASGSYPNSALYIPFNLAAGAAALAVRSLVQNKLYQSPLLAACFSAAGFLNASFVGFSIITVVWHGLFGAFAASLVMIEWFFGRIDRVLQRALNPEATNNPNGSAILARARDDLWSMARLVGQLYLGFAITTGVMMTILFSGGFDSIDAKASAIQMTAGFLLCTGAVYFWAALPFLNRLSAIWEADD